MAMTPKIITSNTALAAVAMLGLLGAFVWGVVEFAPGHRLVLPTNLTLPHEPPHEPTAPPAALDVPFSPNERPDDPARCAVVADRVWQAYEAMVAPQSEYVELFAVETAELVNEYVAARCPSAIHEGDWHTTAQILGVGIAYDAMQSAPHIAGVRLTWDPRAASLVKVAVSTFHVLSPSALCDEALLQNRNDEERALTLSPLVGDCLDAFGD